MVKEELEAVLAEAEEERGTYGRADTGREYLKRLMKSAPKKGSS